MLLKIITYIVIILLSNLISYKIIRHIDKQERKFIQKWELDFIESVKNNDQEEKNNEDPSEDPSKESNDELF